MKELSTIFVYGTLSFDPIISALLGRKLQSAPAKVYGYTRVRVRGKRYPGLVKAAGNTSMVEGRLHNNITQEELRLLNTFEDDFYQLIPIDIELDDAKRVEALTYIIPEENIHFATDEEWDREDFKKKHYKDYMNMVADFRNSYLSGHRKSQEF